MKLFTPTVLRMSADGISNLLDEVWMQGNFYFIAEEAAKANKSLFHKTLQEGFLYYIGKDLYESYLRPHSIIGYGAEKNEDLYFHLYTGLVEIVDFLRYHELETKNCGERLDNYIEGILYEYEETNCTQIGSPEYNSNLKKAWLFLLDINQTRLNELKPEYSLRFSERIFHDREVCEYIATQFHQTRFGWGTYSSFNKGETPRQWVNREKWPKWVERAVYSRDRGSCAICKKSIILESDLLNIDHIISLANGGTNDLINLQLTCPDCNLKKSSKAQQVESSIPNYLGIRRGKNLTRRSSRRAKGARG